MKTDTDNEIKVKVYENKRYERGSEIITHKRCPACGCEYNHILGVRVSIEPDGEKNAGIIWDDRNHQVVQLDMKCENWHEWKLTIADRKGVINLASFVDIETKVKAELEEVLENIKTT